MATIKTYLEYAELAQIAYSGEEHRGQGLTINLELSDAGVSKI